MLSIREKKEEHERIAKRSLALCKHWAAQVESCKEEIEEAKLAVLAVTTNAAERLRLAREELAMTEKRHAEALQFHTDKFAP